VVASPSLIVLLLTRKLPPVKVWTPDHVCAVVTVGARLHLNPLSEVLIRSRIMLPEGIKKRVSSAAVAISLPDVDQSVP